MLNVSWTITDAANYKVNQPSSPTNSSARSFLEELSRARGAIVLTAHMGNYDLGASLFAEKFNREISMVRAPEPDVQTAQHLNASVQRAADGAVKIAYSSGGALLSFDLLNAVRQGEIISIQGDRVIAGVATAPGRMFSPNRARANRAFHSRANCRGSTLSALHCARRLSPLQNHRAKSDRGATPGHVPVR